METESSLFEDDYRLLRQVRSQLSQTDNLPDQLRVAFADVLGGYEALLAETTKIHSIADRQYTHLVETQEQLIEANSELERISIHDKLTGLFNRRKLDETLNLEVLRCERFNCPATMIMVDIDFFKNINDSFGHPAGDKILVELAAILSRRIRQTDFAFRWGGEEFLVLLTETRQADGMSIAETLRQTFERHEWPTVGRVTVSLGVREFQSGWSPENWTEETDKLLFRAKTLGRNRVEGEP